MGYVQIVNVKEQIISSDDIIGQSLANEHTNSLSYVMLKSIMRLTDVYNHSFIRIKFELYSSSATQCWGRIYRDGIPIGTERSTSSSTPVTYTEDFEFTDLGVNQEIQLWVKHSTTLNWANVQNFKICGIAANFADISP